MIAGLSDPRAYPHPVESVTTLQTHISMVCLANQYAYKIRKPVQLGYLDFSTLERRRFFAEEEIRLNRQLAPGIYLGVVPIVQTADGLRVEAPGEPVEWAVKMIRLPEEDTLRDRLERGRLAREELERVAQRIAEFHAHAETGRRIVDSARYPAVRRLIKENLDAARRQLGGTITGPVLDRLCDRTQLALESLRTLIDARAERGMPRDTHGDLRLDHVYLRPDCHPPSDLIIIDRIEFNEGFRYADPVADAAFLAMDLAARGRTDLAVAFRETYIDASGDQEGRPLWPLYVSYRSAVRAKVAAIQCAEAEIPEISREAAARRARAHWLLALNALETPDRRAALLLIGGLPGTGKSTLARELGERCGFHVLRSDVVRKEMARTGQVNGREITTVEELYTPEWTDRTYRQCLRRAEAILHEGGRVIVDATFAREAHRRAFRDLAVNLALPVVLLRCIAGDSTIRSRLDRRHGDASDADWLVHQRLAAAWEPITDSPLLPRVDIVTDVDLGEVAEQARNVLQATGLVGTEDPWRDVP